ncbi:unnamed protein product [Effrenium voratum]|uniref:K Homology domain-containing protein n=1 Tax=Effrenium voratum TaxID=2562239 RepID=A0AA36IKK5_9DINO|nr:unnamed protein product [Effrenium voratum]
MDHPAKRSKWDDPGGGPPRDFAAHAAPESNMSNFSSAAAGASGPSGFDGYGGFGGYGGCGDSGASGAGYGDYGAGAVAGGCGAGGCDYGAADYCAAGYGAGGGGAYGCGGCGGCGGFGGWDQGWADPSQPSAASAPPMQSQMEMKVMQIPSKQKGGLIGVGGEAIARIRQASGANIKIEHQSGDYLCTITITGNVVLAEQLIHERLAEQYQPRDGWASKIVDVDPTVVGQVIGPGGANLRHIFDTTGCKIKFIQAAEVDPMAMPGKQVACIRGPPDRLHEGFAQEDPGCGEPAFGANDAAANANGQGRQRSGWLCGHACRPLGHGWHAAWTASRACERWQGDPLQVPLEDPGHVQERGFMPFLA